VCRKFKKVENLCNNHHLLLFHQRNLEELRLDGNNLSFVPEFISKLGKLKVLDLSRNDLSFYPSEFDIGLVEVK
jgi:Leucine-rich repeat (LRR) protein